MEATSFGGLGVARLARLGPSRGSRGVGAEAGPYQAVDKAMWWAAGRQDWIPPNPGCRQLLYCCTSHWISLYLYYLNGFALAYGHT